MEHNIVPSKLKSHLRSQTRVGITIEEKKFLFVAYKTQHVSFESDLFLFYALSLHPFFFFCTSVMAGVEWVMGKAR